MEIRILLVDDEIDFVETMIKRFRIRKMPIETAGSGAEALKLLDEFKELSGIDLRSYKWDAAKLHKALVIAETGILDRWGGLERMVEHMQEATKLVTTLKAAIDSGPNL